MAVSGKTGVTIGPLLVTIVTMLAGPAQADAPPRLSMPIACEPGKTCFVQSHVDIDPGPLAHDFACGSATYDGHKGTDIRVLSSAAAEKGIDVLASADGTVKGVRDGMEDRLIREAGADSVKDRECGNGVVIDHGGGWETQYCHMKKSSVVVRSGDLVKRGQKLGNVGFSGLADFAHVHLEVRHAGKVVDPYSAQEQDAVCLKDPGAAQGLWDDTAAKAFKYANGEILAAGFTSELPDHEKLERNDEVPAPDARSAQLVFYARLINLRLGDDVRISVSGPEGFAVENATRPLDRNKATYTLYAGKKLTTLAWAAGKYLGSVQIIRAGAPIAEKQAEIELKN